MHPAAFKPAIPASERPEIHTLYRAATGIVSNSYLVYTVPKLSVNK